ncbi:hypothetical protein Lepto7376_2927 [[Leptolyngbya] sp. PCC 7376]|uniref:hypothetical protein n=1 Tax=[Leptolyngbya] sp. PCC 7376 TaxID=111781 RepID=UPI00029F0B04|nr:hypothetical protein [[Leptolyngbya] sp. PCC 7376]AFY39179.1 hypothetical protein Lepto7376_2927 [[Leptolyngbya] sp. PCC 7376]
MELFLERPYREVAIADFGDIILSIPTDKSIQPQSSNPFERLYPQRIYSRKGWFFYREKWLGLLHDLNFTVTEKEENPALFCGIPQLTPDNTVSFEVNSWRTLPEAIAMQATLTYQFEDEQNSYYSLFRNLKPQFVRVYPFKSVHAFSKQIRWLLEEKRQFNHR